MKRDVCYKNSILKMLPLASIEISLQAYLAGFKLQVPFFYSLGSFWGTKVTGLQSLGFGSKKHFRLLIDFFKKYFRQVKIAQILPVGVFRDPLSYWIKKWGVGNFGKFHFFWPLQFSSPLIRRKSGSWTIGSISFFLSWTITYYPLEFQPLTPWKKNFIFAFTFSRIGPYL